jgi:hypothetical protein
MLESQKREKEDSDERNAIQSGEDHWHFEGGGVQDQYRWRRKYGGLSVSESRRLKDLEKENSRLKRLLAERDIEIDVMKDELSKN